MACHCKNWGRTRVADRRRLEYKKGSFKRNYKHLNCLKEKENIESPYNKFNVLATGINAGISESEGTKVKVRRTEGRPLREVMIKIGLERVDTQEGIIVEALLDSGATGLVMSSKFARK